MWQWWLKPTVMLSLSRKAWHWSVLGRVKMEHVWSCCVREISVVMVSRPWRHIPSPAHIVSLLLWFSPRSIPASELRGLLCHASWQPAWQQCDMTAVCAGWGWPRAGSCGHGCSLSLPWPGVLLCSGQASTDPALFRGISPAASWTTEWAWLSPS